MEIIELSFAGSPVRRLTGSPAHRFPFLLLTPSTTTDASACASRTTERETV